MTDYVKNVLLGLLTFVTVSLVVAFINTDSASAGANDTQLIEIAKQLSLEGETIPITNMEVHLTTDREYAVVTFTQGGEDYIVNIAFSDIPAGLIDI